MAFVNCMCVKFDLFSLHRVGGTSALIFVYVVETLPLKYRGKMTAVLSSAFIVGQIMVAGKIFVARVCFILCSFHFYV